MKLNTKSWHFFIYRLAYGTPPAYSMPTNFCPYFWKGIVLGSLLNLIFVPIALPFMFLTWVYNKVPGGKTDNILEDGIMSKNLAFSIAIDAGLIFLFCMVAMWWRLHVKESTIMIIGIVGWVIGLIITVAVIYHNWKENHIYTYSHKKEKKPSIIKIAIKAWYNKHCPIIKWEGEEENNDYSY